MKQRKSKRSFLPESWKTSTAAEEEAEVWTLREHALLLYPLPLRFTEEEDGMLWKGGGIQK